MKKIYFLMILVGSLSLHCAMSQSLNSVSTSSQSLNSVSEALNSVSSISTSLSSISGSVTSAAKSRVVSYESDVETLTYLFIQSGKNHSFSYEIQQIGLEHGITMWQQEASSYLGIGRGLRKAGLKQNDLDSFFQKAKFENPQIIRLVQKGYQS